MGDGCRLVLVNQPSFIRNVCTKSATPIPIHPTMMFKSTRFASLIAFPLGCIAIPVAVPADPPPGDNPLAIGEIGNLQQLI